ncbi:MAG: methyltransferase domain-containing protein [Deltaproteobacteria bacterium]|nr:methyltransferase domain-containing protein [Deltaproteobacteria bacterium]
MSLASDDWEQRYREQTTQWDLGEPAPPLVRASSLLTPVRTVVVGCGTGQDALSLASRGFDVTGVDFAPSAVRIATESAAKRKLTARFIQADVLTLPGENAPWDLWVEHTCFCAIDPSQRDAYVEAAHRSIAPNGKLLALFYAHKREGGPPFATTRAEVEKRFGARFELVSMEVPPDSIERRRGEELLTLFKRR